jgi:hypothetical protein
VGHVRVRIVRFPQVFFNPPQYFIDIQQQKEDKRQQKQT